jgi:hypothetical protein
MSVSRVLGIEMSACSECIHVVWVLFTYQIDDSLCRSDSHRGEFSHVGKSTCKRMGF